MASDIPENGQKQGFIEPRYDEVYEEFVRDFEAAEHKTSADKQDSRHIESCGCTENGQIPADEQKQRQIGPFKPKYRSLHGRGLPVPSCICIDCERIRSINFRAVAAQKLANLRQAADEEIYRRMSAPEPFTRCRPVEQADPFEGVWDAMYVHQCTGCGYQLSELKRRALQGSKFFTGSCRRCGGDSWTEAAGLKLVTYRRELERQRRIKAAITAFIRKTYNSVARVMARIWHK